MGGGGDFFEILDGWTIFPLFFKSGGGLQVCGGGTFWKNGLRMAKNGSKWGANCQNRVKFARSAKILTICAKNDQKWSILGQFLEIFAKKCRSAGIFLDGWMSQPAIKLFRMDGFPKKISGWMDVPTGSQNWGGPPPHPPLGPALMSIAENI